MEMVLTTGALRRAKLRSNRHHQQTNSISGPSGVHLLLSSPVDKATAGYLIVIRKKTKVGKNVQ